MSEPVRGSETLRTIYERRSVRKYSDRPVDKELIEQILDAGRMAPSAINRQPWKFYMLTKKEAIGSLSKEIAKIAGKEFLKSGPKQILKAVGHLLHYPHNISLFKGEYFIFHGAPVVIFITGPRDYEWAPLDIGMCSQNIMLAAKSLGLDTVLWGWENMQSIQKIIRNCYSFVLNKYIFLLFWAMVVKIRKCPKEQEIMLSMLIELNLGNK